MSAPARARRALAPPLAALLLYAAASALLLGRRALADPSHLCACTGGAGDPPTYMWALAWWPHALTHELDPFFTRLVWSPAGVNVAAAPMIPLPSVLAWPLTAGFGPLPSYDVLAILSPAVAATCMFVLCRHVTGRLLPSFAGGWVFGFSSYELSQRVGHANLMLIALLPLAALAALARTEGRIGARAYVAAMTLLIAGQLLTSAEILATSCAFGLLAAALAFSALTPIKRRRLVRTMLESAAAGVLAALITSPYLYWAAIRQHPVPVPGAATTLVTDLAGTVVPTPVTLLRFATAVAARFPGNPAEQGAYFGVPLLIVLAWALCERRHTPAMRVLGPVAAVALVLSFGSHLVVGGDSTIAMPWALATHLPIAKAAVPDRVILYAWFALALAVAMFLARPAGSARLAHTTRAALARWALVLVGIVLILPDSDSSLFSSRPSLPAMFEGRAYTRVLPRGGQVLVLPYGYRGYSMLWQAEAGFYFSMPEGNLSGVTPEPFRSDPVTMSLLAFPPAPVSPAQLGAFIRRYGVRNVLVDAADPEGWPAELAALGLSGTATLGTIVYVVPSSSSSTSP